MADDANGETEADEESGLSRRRLVALLGGGALLAGGAYAGVETLGDGDRSAGTPTTETATRTSTATETLTATPDRALELAERFAPDLYFGARERWFPTDPRPYASTDDDGRTVVDGFDALDGYTAAFDDDPPAPTAFYRVVDVSDRLSVVQYWFYSVFDQFSVNFHWHDWELLQVFVDVDADRPTLYCASAHSRKVPNNEFLDPDTGDRVGVVSEVGSHSSALGVNEERETFQRFPTGDLIADITNRAVSLGDVAESIPMAYGLPRDEGFSLPYAVPELDGEPLYDLDRLPNVAREDFVDEDVTVRRFDQLASPPSLPTREHGLTLSPDDAGDYRYDLVPMAETDYIDEYAGPQLSFEFSVPSFAEDAVAGHITSAGVPQTQARYDDPVEDVTDPRHRSTLADRYESVESGGPVSQLVGGIREMVPDVDAPTDAGLTLSAPAVEAVALLESEGTGVPTTNGLLLVDDVPPGEHRLTVNGPGVAPYAETFTHDGGERAVGAEGRIAVVSNENAVKVRADASDTAAGVARVRVEDDYGGAVYDARPPEGDRFGVYVHRAGAYRVSLTDREGEVGVFRVNPGPNAAEVAIENPTTGKRSRTRYLVAELEEALARVAELREREDVPEDEFEPIGNQLREALADAERADSLVAENEREGANEALGAVAEHLSTARSLLEAREDRIPSPVYEQFRRRLRRLAAATTAAREAGASEADAETPTATPAGTETETETATATPTNTETEVGQRTRTDTETETDAADGS
jgi:hypothetical protein